MNSAILFLVFNRPDTTRQVFETIRAARPPRLYVAADGPRATREGEADRCAVVRQIATDVDWPCEVTTLFRDRNLGCRAAVSSAISWFFEHEEEGIILEDDVVPVQSFFAFCDELLERYRDDERVGMVSGCNLVSSYVRSDSSYWFSRHTHIWGWATWRRAWKDYDVRMSGWPAWRDSGGLARANQDNRHSIRYWRDVFDRTHKGMIDTWDYQWTFSCWLHERLAAMPAVNLTLNLGFGHDATHTVGATPAYVVESMPKPLPMPLHHPSRVERSAPGDDAIDRRVFGIGWMQLLRSHLKRLPGLDRAWGRLKRLAL